MAAGGRWRRRRIARAQRADPVGQRPQRSSDPHRAAGYPHARFGGRPPRPARRAAPGRARGRRRDGRLRVRHLLVAGPARSSGSRSWSTARSSRRWRTACPGSTRCASSRRRRATRAASGGWPGSRRGRAQRRARSGCARGWPAARASTAELGPDPAPRRPSRRSPEAAPATVAICMATYEPPRRRCCARQLDSIRAQTPTDWVCVISRRLLVARRSAQLERLVAGDPRFVVSRSPRRLGFYRNFERALALAPAERARSSRSPTRTTPGIPTSSRRCSRALGDAQLVYSDARVIARDGAEVAATYWERRRQQPRRPARRCSSPTRSPARRRCSRARCSTTRCRSRPRSSRTSTTTGSGSVALALRRDRATSTARSTTTSSTAAPRSATRPPTGCRRCATGSARCGATRASAIRLWRMHYFVDVCAAAAADRDPAAALRRPDDAGQAPRARPLRARGRLARCRSPGWAPAARASSSARRPQTLGAEWMLAARLRLAPRCSAATAREPAAARACGSTRSRRRRSSRGRARRRRASRTSAAIAEKIAPLRLAVARRRARAGQPADPDHRPRALLRRLHRQAQPRAAAGATAACGCASSPSTRSARCPATGARTSRPTAGWPASSTASRSRSGASRTASRSAATTASSPRRGGRRTSRDAARRELGGERFLYLIQEYEPFTFPMGTYAALADESYRAPARRAVLHRAAARLVPAPRARRLRAEAAAATASAAFQNAITAIAPPSAAELAARDARAAAVLRAPGAARRAQHVRARRARARPCGGARRVRDGWELRRDRHGRGRGGGSSWAAARRSSCSRAPRRATTAALLRDHDVGLALMYTPHPSLVPIEMASAGMLTVTNTFENKTAEALARDLGEPHRRRADRRRRRRGARRAPSPAPATRERRAAGARVRVEPRLGHVVRRRAARSRDRAALTTETRAVARASVRHLARRREVG